MPRLKSYWYIFIAVLLLLLGLQVAYGIVVIAYYDPASRISGDFSAYAPSLLQRENPLLFSKDALFGSGQYTDALWSSSGLFLELLLRLYHWTGERLEIATFILSLGLLVGFFYLMYLLAFEVLHDPWLAIGIAAVSSIAWEIFLIVDVVLPQAMFAMLTPLFSWLLLRTWLLPGLRGEKIQIGGIIVAGLGIGIASISISSTAALGLMCFVLGTAGLQWLFRRLPSWSIILFAVALLPPIALRIGSGSGIVTNLSDASIQFVTEFYASLENNTIAYGLYGLITLISAGLAWRFPGLRLPKLVFITAQLWLALLVLLAGWTPIFVWLYGVYRIFTRQDDELDKQLAITIALALSIGQPLQLLLYYLWRATDITGLIGFIFQVFRFTRYGYIPLYLLAARVVYFLIHHPALSPTPNNALSHSNASNRPYSVEQMLVMISLFVLLALNALTVSYAGLGQILLIIAIILLLLLRGIPSATLKNLATLKSWGVAALMGSTSIALMLYLIATFQWVIINKPLTTDSYIEMTQWVKANTPVDSAFHLPNLDDSFRFAAQRSLIIGEYDSISRNLYSGGDPYYLQSLIQKAQTEISAERLTRFAAEHGAGYVLLTAGLPSMRPALYNDVWYAPEVVFENAVYRVVQVKHVEWLNDQPYPLTTTEAEAQKAFQPDVVLEPNTVIFNPVAGDIFNYDGVKNWLAAYTLKEGANPQVVFTLVDWMQRMQSAGDIAPEIANRWFRNYLPGDLKDADIGYVFVISAWLENAGAYVQSLFADETRYALVHTLLSPLDNSEYRLYAVVGNEKEAMPLDPPLDAGFILPAYAQPEDAILIAAPTLWRAMTTQAALSPIADSLFLVLMPSDAEKETITPMPDHVLYELNATTWAQISEFVGKRERLWYVDVADIAHITPTVMSYFQQQGYSVDGGRPFTLPIFPGMILRLYQLQQQPVALQTQWVFGNNELELLHDDLLFQTDTGQSVVACSPIGLRTWWTLRRIPDHNYFITLRLMTENGQLVAQSDGRIGEHHLVELAPNTLIFDERWLTIPCDTAPSTYVLQAGLYFYENNIFSDLISVRTADNQETDSLVTFATIEIIISD